MSDLRRVDHVWFWVADMNRAVDFYTGRLGLQLRMRHGNDWAEVDGGDIRIGLHGGPGADASPTPGGTVVFEVDDLDLAKAGLEQRSLAFDEHLGEVPGYARYASFTDPDGNSMQLIEYVGGPGGSSSEREGASGSPPEGGPGGSSSEREGASGSPPKGERG
jgi:catechol 2,3-dioxygenase-like lactoylglutathione lyase family enzyme